MKNKFLLLILLFVSTTITAQKKIFTIFDVNGNQTSYKKVLKEAQKSNIVLFGELHDNPINHWLQLELTNDIYNKSDKLTLGAEMMESDNQLVIDEYLSGLISKTKLISE